MTWRYQLMDHGRYLAVHEYYTIEEGEPLYTTDPVSIYGENVEEVIEQLSMILEDVRRNGVIKYE